MVEVKRKPNESVGSLMRRFNRFVQSSGVLVRAKKSQFRIKKKTERKEKMAAIMVFALILAVISDFCIDFLSMVILFTILYFIIIP